MRKPLLEVKDLTCAFRLEGKPIAVTHQISFSIQKGEILGIVGESGSGKSVTAKTIMRLLPSPPSEVLGGEVLYNDMNLLLLPEHEMRHIRGNKISMIFQEPMTSLNPVYTCGDQIMEALILHRHMTRGEAVQKAEELLELAGMSAPKKRLKNYPHELSGGMRQRVMIAMALACNPELLIADEPTTALDPTIQAQILALIEDLQQKLNMSVLYITHDLGVVAELCERVVVMYAGIIMEIANTKELFSNPCHPYTHGLMQAIPKLDQRCERLHSIPGTVPAITEMPEGCRFHLRCPWADEACRVRCPDMADVGNGHMVRCVHIDQVREAKL